MKADITLALSMLSLVLLIFIHEAMPAPDGTLNNDTQTEKTSTRDGLLNDTRNSSDQSTPGKHDGGTHGNHSVVMTTVSPSGTPTSTENQTPATSGSTPQQTEKTTPPPPLIKQTMPPPKTSPITSTHPSRTKPPPVTLNTGSIVVVVLFIIILLLITVLCFYKWITRHSGQDSSAPRLLLGVRERMRGRFRSLEDWLGLSLWPGKRVVEGDEEEGEGEEGKSGDGEAAAGVGGGKDEGDSSDDYSSLDGIDLSERAKNLEDEAVTRKSGNEGGQDNTKGERTDGRKEGGEEEQTGGISSEGDTCDLTAL